MTTRELALLVHLAGVISLFSGIAVAAVAFAGARRREQPAEIALLLGLTRAGVVLVGAGATVALGAGLWLADLGDHSLTGGWLGAALALFVVALVLGAVGGRPAKRARLLASRLAADASPAGPELRALLDSRAGAVANWAATAALLAVLVLMVVKP